MLSLFQALLPKEEAYFAHFNAHAAVLVNGAGALRRVLDGGAAVEAHCAEIMRQEDDADVIAQRVLLGVRKTFITPFDRGDIRDLINSMDDAIDQMQKTAKAILLFGVRDFDPQMREMGDEIVEAAAITRQAVGLLDRLNKNAGDLGELTQKLSELEDRSDAVYDAGMKALVEATRQDPMAYIARAEIYDHLEKVMDRFEDVSDRISAILTENL
jgi:predicted phosphate transport protein (TIGR00153 family)